MNELRFQFGENWKSFLRTLDDDRIERAQRSLAELLRLDAAGNDQPLEGKTFLDLGCGSGLFSLVAHRLGGHVVSIDFDRESVRCTEELRSLEQVDHTSWIVQQGSVLDEEMLQRLGHFDIVYSWGVLHHTGDMNRAVRLASGRVAPGGIFAIAIYNDQGSASRRWLRIKQAYHRLPKFLRPLWVAAVASCYESKFALARLARGRNPLPFSDWKAKRDDRGMSAWHDWVDWVGGLPFEVARPEAIILPLVEAGFDLVNLKTVGNGWGCNEYVFRKSK
jgi:2-polyprenyl-6-hydroxyphenyl methylase/3-demethylubiquinone-9 3-methyltransferase